MTSDSERGAGLHLLPESQGRYVAVKAVGTLSDGHYKQFQPVLEKLISRHRPVRLFVDLTAFEGWTAHALWDDFSFGMRHARDFERIALVGDARWESLVARMADVVMNCQVRHFNAADRQIGWDYILDLD